MTRHESPGKSRRPRTRLTPTIISYHIIFGKIYYIFRYDTIRYDLYHSLDPVCRTIWAAHQSSSRHQRTGKSKCILNYILFPIYPQRGDRRRPQNQRGIVLFYLNGGSRLHRISSSMCSVSNWDAQLSAFEFHACGMRHYLFHQPTLGPMYKNIYYFSK